MPPLRHVVGEKWNFFILLGVDIVLFMCVVMVVISMTSLLVWGSATLESPTILWMAALGRNGTIAFTLLTYYLKQNYDFKKVRNTTHEINGKMQAVVLQAGKNGQLTEEVKHGMEEVKQKQKETVEVIAKRVEEAKNEPCPEQKMMPRDVRDLYRFIRHVSSASMRDILTDPELIRMVAKDICPYLSYELRQEIRKELEKQRGGPAQF